MVSSCILHSACIDMPSFITWSRRSISRNSLLSSQYNVVLLVPVLAVGWGIIGSQGGLLFSGTSGITMGFNDCDGHTNTTAGFTVL